LLPSLTRQDSRLYEELGNDSKYAIKEVGTISFQLESSNSLEVKDVFYVVRLDKNLLSVSIMEDKGFTTKSESWQAFIRLEASSPIIVQVINVRKGNLYKLQGKPV